MNPYFQENPIFYLTTLKVLGAVGLVVGLFGVYVALFRSPKKSNKLFRWLILYHIIMAIYFQLSLTVLSPPRIYLPYMAVDFPGIYTILGIPPAVQLGLLLASIIAAASVITPLFYYRMVNMLQKEHILNSRVLHALFYFSVYIVGPALPLFLILLSVQDQTDVKNYLYSVFKMDYKGFWSPETVAFRLDLSNGWAVLIGCGFCAGLVGVNVLIFVCSCVIYKSFVRRMTESVSIQHTKQKKALVMSLMISVVVILVIVAVIIPVVGFLLMTNSPRADLLNFVILLGACAFPIALLAFLATYAPYRGMFTAFIRRHFGKRKKSVGPVKGSAAFFTRSGSVVLSVTPVG